MIIYLLIGLQKLALCFFFMTISHEMCYAFTWLKP